MTEYTIGEVYEFTALYIETDSNGINYIVMNDGSGVAQRVKPFDFQTEWSEIQGMTIRCYCEGISRLGRPYFKQSYYDVLTACYNGDGETHTFTVKNVRIDDATQMQFYELTDVFGLKHRYYSKASYENYEELTLRVENVVEKSNNRAYLELKAVEEGDNTSHTEDGMMAESLFGCENQIREFKSTIVFPAKTTDADIKTQLGQIARALAGFMNADGGTLYIGVNDSGRVCGIEQDLQYLNSDDTDRFTYKMNYDHYELKIRNTVVRLLGHTANSAIHFDFRDDGGKVYCVITVDRVDRPVYYNERIIFQRQGNMTPWLKGEDITYFIAKRLGLASATKAVTPVMTSPSAEPKVGVEVNREEEVAVEATEAEANEPAEFYITFYKDGGWSYQNKNIAGDDILCNIAVTKTQRKKKEARLVQCYDNGCMNVVLVKDIRKKTSGRLYKNGWNTEAKLVAAFCADVHDQIAFWSKDEDGREWVKVHYVSCVEPHTSMHTKGNIIINPKHDNAVLTAVKLITNKMHQHLVSALVCNDNETSTTLGVKVNNSQYSAPINVLKKVCNYNPC